MIQKTDGTNTCTNINVRIVLPLPIRARNIPIIGAYIINEFQYITLHSENQVSFGAIAFISMV